MLWCFSLLQPATGDFFCILCFKNEFPFDFQSLSWKFPDDLENVLDQPKKTPEIFCQIKKNTVRRKGVTVSVLHFYIKLGCFLPLPRKEKFRETRVVSIKEKTSFESFYQKRKVKTSSEGNVFKGGQPEHNIIIWPTFETKKISQFLDTRLDLLGRVARKALREISRNI